MVMSLPFGMVMVMRPPLRHGHGHEPPLRHDHGHEPPLQRGHGHGRDLLPIRGSGTAASNTATLGAVLVLASTRPKTEGAKLYPS